MSENSIKALTAEIAGLRPVRDVGRVRAVEGNMIRVGGLGGIARTGDQLRVFRHNAPPLCGEVLQLHGDDVSMLPDHPPEGVSVGDRAALLEPVRIAPSDNWVGRVLDPDGRPLDGKPLLRGTHVRPLRASPPQAAQRRALGDRLETGMAAFNTLLPIVRGQRIGLFAGSGVGKSSLLAHLARNMQADVVVIAMIGERGRELGDFIDNVLGEEGLKRSVIVAATSDQSPLVRRKCAWTAMAVAEHFRDEGLQVLFLADSITRFAEAHREVAVAAGEMPALRGYPPSTAHMIMSLCERAGPGTASTGDITAILSVLVAGSDMDEPVADILRGVLDGHVVLERKIAERGRYPAIDLLRSVSRSLPTAASEDENHSIRQARQLLGAYDQSELMIRAGLYTEGSDALLDQAVKVWPELDGYLAEIEAVDTRNSFSKLDLILHRAGNGLARKPQIQQAHTNATPVAGRERQTGSRGRQATDIVPVGARTAPVASR